MTTPPLDLVGAGVLPPRARYATDARTLPLDGEWSVRFSPSWAEAPDDLGDPELDIDGWDRIPVPSSWPMQPSAPASERPWYTNTRFPFPIDPPHVPDADVIGDHAVRFDWEPGGATRLRLEGVDAAGTVYVNGVEAGRLRGSRIVHELDISHLVRAGGNLLVVRVARWAETSYLEDQDMWWLPGVFRPVTVLDRPVDGIDDVRVEADWRDGVATLRVVVDTPAAEPVLVELPELGLRATAGEAVTVPGAEPWSAERPRLYDLVVTAPGETARLRIGFRTVRIDGHRLLVNDLPIRLRGVNRHEHHPDLGRVVPRSVVQHELRLMKRHSIDAIRTSHYPPHPDLLELADELGFWLIVECDYETHGFEHVGWRGNPSDDPAWQAALVDRMARTVERDRNHPSVIMWSLGNEAGTGRNLAAMAAEARRRDPSRPIHYEGDWSSPDVDVYSRMYPHPDEVALIGRGEEPALDDPALDARRRGMPFVLCEYAHAMGNGPGGLAEYQTAIETGDRNIGGFVWEWLEHGIRRRAANGREFWAYGGDFGEPVHDGNFVADGLVDADRRPRPGLADVARVYAPVAFEFDGDAVRVTNRRDHIGTSWLRAEWMRETPDGALAHGTLPLPEIAPRGTATVELPPDARGDGVLTVVAVLAADTAWAEAGHELAWAQRGALAVPPPLDASAAPRELGDELGLGPARLRPRTGGLRIDDLDLGSPELVLWRAPTDNDRGRGLLPLRGHDREPMSEADMWEAAELPRLLTRLVSVQTTDDAVEVETRVGPAVYDWAARVRIRYTSDGAGLGMSVRVDPIGDWPCTWARVGLRFRLPFEPTARWRGLGPGQSYPDTGLAARLGSWSATLDELRTEYARPQESGARAGVVTAVLSGPDGRGLQIDGDGFAFTANPWTAAELAAAPHPTDLPDPAPGCWLTLDLAQHGVGTAACGPGVLPAYRLEPRPVEGRLTLRRR